MTAFEHVKLSLCVLNYLDVLHFPMDCFKIIVFFPFLVCINMCTSVIDFVSLPVMMASLCYHLLNCNCAPSTVLCIVYPLSHMFSQLPNGQVLQSTCQG